MSGKRAKKKKNEEREAAVAYFQTLPSKRNNATPTPALPTSCTVSVPLRDSRVRAARESDDDEARQRGKRAEEGGLFGPWQPFLIVLVRCAGRGSGGLVLACDEQGDRARRCMWVRVEGRHATA